MISRDRGDISSMIFKCHVKNIPQITYPYNKMYLCCLQEGSKLSAILFNLLLRLLQSFGVFDDSFCRLQMILCNFLYNLEMFIRSVRQCFLCSSQQPSIKSLLFPVFAVFFLSFFLYYLLVVPFSFVSPLRAEHTTTTRFFSRYDLYVKVSVFVYMSRKPTEGPCIRGGTRTTYETIVDAIVSRNLPTLVPPNFCTTHGRSVAFSRSWDDNVEVCMLVPLLLSCLYRKRADLSH